MTDNRSGKAHGSVVIPAHDEASVLGMCLRRLRPAEPPLGADLPPSGWEIVVVPNGCTDETAAVARAYPGVTVVELAAPSKAAALNAGDRVASRFPRLYLDADVTLSDGALQALRAALDGGALAAVPRREVVCAGRPWTVRAYYAVHSRLPANVDGLYGRGAIMLAEAARARFELFPEAIADDLFLDSVVSDAERVQVREAAALVQAPARLGDLVRRLSRVRAGNTAMRRSSAAVRRADRFSWLRDVVARRPWLLPAGVWYASVTLLAAVRAKRARTIGWGRDESRAAATPAGGGRAATPARHASDRADKPGAVA